MPCTLLPIFNDQRVTNSRHRRNESFLFIFLKEVGDDQTRRDLLSLKWEEVITLADEAEKILKTMLVHDYAYGHFSSQVSQYMKLAELLEMRESYLHEIEGK